MGPATLAGKSKLAFDWRAAENRESNTLLDVVRRHVPDFEAEYARRGWKMFPNIERVYVNERARRELGWRPRYDFAHVIARLKSDEDPRSALARLIGSKGYHSKQFDRGPYPV